MIERSRYQAYQKRRQLCHSFRKRKMADRRPLNPGVVVPKPGGGTQPRDRNNDGRVRGKRSDAGKPRK